MLKPGQVINRFQVEAEIGRGGMGVVYRVRHLELDSVLALKMVLIQHPGLFARLLQEGRAQARLRHPNVVHVSDVVRDEERCGLLMEYVAGPTLDRWLGLRVPSPAEVEDIFTGVLAGVEHAHASGVIHRDLKARNILLAFGHNGLMPKVSDFGIARLAVENAGDRLTLGDVPMGTPGYMAPEQVRNARDVDHRADIFALGALLYRLLCGTPPFEGGESFEVMDRTVRGDFTPPRRYRSDLPTRYERIINACLQVDPNQRPQSCGELRDMLRGAPPPPSRESRPEKTGGDSFPVGLEVLPAPATRRSEEEPRPAKRLEGEASGRHRKIEAEASGRHRKIEGEAGGRQRKADGDASGRPVEGAPARRPEEAKKAEIEVSPPEPPRNEEATEEVEVARGGRKIIGMDLRPQPPPPDNSPKTLEELLRSPEAPPPETPAEPVPEPPPPGSARMSLWVLTLPGLFAVLLVGYFVSLDGCPSGPLKTTVVRSAPVEAPVETSPPVVIPPPAPPVEAVPPPTEEPVATEGEAATIPVPGKPIVKPNKPKPVATTEPVAPPPETVPEPVEAVKPVVTGPAANEVWVQFKGRTATSVRLKCLGYDRQAPLTDGLAKFPAVPGPEVTTDCSFVPTGESTHFTRTPARPGKSYKCNAVGWNVTCK